jgi:hypothetical protein
MDLDLLKIQGGGNKEEKKRTQHDNRIKEHHPTFYIIPDSLKLSL